MDNITHTVIGLVAGDSVHHATNRHEMQSAERRRLFFLASILGSNIADLDVLLKSFYPQPVGTLLHHRGYTHTLVAAIPEALLVIGFLFLLRGGLVSKRFGMRDWTLAFVTALVGVLLHIFADSWNSYGVHPFYPFDNSWYYGDYIFIIEPFVWAICGAWIVIELSLAWRILSFVTFGLIIGFGFGIDSISARQVLFLIGLTSGSTLLMGILPSAKRSATALVFIAITLGVFHHYSGRAREFVTRIYAGEFVQDIALSPMPMNPFCWTALAASIENDDFVIRRANISLWPERVPALNCRSFERDVKPVSKFVSNASIDWNREYRTRLGLFKSYTSDCYFKDWMRFARMPYIGNTLARDVRFANRGGRNFTDLILKPGRECMEDVPPWIPPRQNLITESQ